jgi:hypothetical protein
MKPHNMKRPSKTIKEVLRCKSASKHQLSAAVSSFPPNPNALRAMPSISGRKSTATGKNLKHEGAEAETEAEMSSDNYAL